MHGTNKTPENNWRRVVSINTGLKSASQWPDLSEMVVFLRRLPSRHRNGWKVGGEEQRTEWGLEEPQHLRLCMPRVLVPTIQAVHHFTRRFAFLIFFAWRFAIAPLIPKSGSRSGLQLGY